MKLNWLIWAIVFTAVNAAKKQPVPEDITPRRDADVSYRSYYNPVKRIISNLPYSIPHPNFWNEYDHCTTSVQQRQAQQMVRKITTKPIYSNIPYIFIKCALNDNFRSD